MKIVKDKITIDELKKMAEAMFEDLVKAVVDVKKEIMAVDAGMHIDEEQMLLENGSRQQNLWGINIHPNKDSDKMIEFDSMINLRPSQGNRSRGVDKAEIREKIEKIVNKLVVK